MSESTDEPRVLGSIETATAEVFAKRGWRQVTMEQTGPDGTEVLAMLLFHICPVCSACIPLGTEEDPLPDEHRDWHLAESQALDEIVTALNYLLPSSDPVPDPDQQADD